MSEITLIENDLAVLHVNGKGFVSGLLWKPLTNVLHHKAEARKIGKREGMDLVSIRRGKVLQAGFAPRSKRQGRNKGTSLQGLYSLASALAGVLGDNCIAAFDVGDGNFAFVAVHKGGIVPGRDLVGVQERISDLLRETYSDIHSTNVTPRIIAPAAWGFGGEELTLEALLQPAEIKKEYRLHSLSSGVTPKQMALAASVIGAVGMAGFAGIHWWRATQAEEAERVRVAQLQASKAQHAAELAKAKAAQQREWEVTPSAADFLSGCTVSLDHVALDIGGWPFVKADCQLGAMGQRDKDMVVAAYARESGATVTDFLAAAKAIGAAPVIIGEGDAGAVSLRLPVTAPAAGAQAALPSMNDQIAALRTRMQSLPEGMAKASFKPVPWVKPKNQPDAVAPTWKTYSVELTSKLDPNVLLEGVNATGLRLFSVEVTRAKSELNWTTKGELYGQ